MHADQSNERTPGEQESETGAALRCPMPTTPHDLVQLAVDQLDHGQPGAAKRILLRVLQEI
jgi:hypothetical protein